MTTKLQQFCIDILPVIQAGAKGERVGCLVSVAGRLMAVPGGQSFHAIKQHPASFYLSGSFYCQSSLLKWKSTKKSHFGAVRFQRVILEGEAV